MPKTKISEYSATANSNTDVASVNIDEGCAPSGINNAIRAVMGHLKDFQAGTSGDAFNGATNGAHNGSVGATTPAAGTFTTLSASSTVSGTGFSTYLESPPAIGGTAAAAVSSTSLAYSTTLTGGTGVVNLGSGQFYKNALGNVGIGTSSPNYKMTLNGGSGATVIQLCNTASGTTANDGFLIYQDGVDCRLQNTEAGNMLLYTGNAERARIDSSGNLLVGTTSASGHVSINGITGSQGTGLFINGWGSGIGSAVVLTAANTSNSDAIYFNTPGANVGKIAITSTATSYVTSSDYRLKENVQPMTGALSVVAQLNPCTYTWKEAGVFSQGFIAHELQAVVPECVTGEKDAVDADGNPVYQGIDTSFLVATLTAAIQEQQAMLVSLKAINDTQAQAITSLQAAATTQEEAFASLAERITALEGA